MPTARPRHTITETDEVTRAIDDAARHWPEEASARGRLLLLLVQAGHRAIEQADNEESQRRRDAVQRTAGALTGVYPADYLEQLRDDWPS